MKMMTKGLVSIALLATAFTVGCGSSSGTNDAGVGGSTGTGGDIGTGGTGGSTANPCPGVTLFHLTSGASCFDITGVAAGSNDMCMIGVADPATASGGFIGSALLVNYDTTAGTVAIGRMGSLGQGSILCNMGTLNRTNMPTDSEHPGCSWDQTDTSMFSLTADDEFDLSVTENQQSFTASCPASDVTCTSTWTWHMKKSTNTALSPTSAMPCQ
jgi:hypothetical protein